MKLKLCSLAALLSIVAVSCTKDPEGSPVKTYDSKVQMTEINGNQDYIELYNAGNETESLEGFKIRRMRMKDGQPDEQTIWKGTKYLKIGAGERIVLSYVEGKDDNDTYPRNLRNPISTKKNAYMWLQDPAEVKLTVFQRGTEGIGWGEVRMQKVEKNNEALSYSLTGTAWKYALPTMGRENGAAIGSIDQTMLTVSINEISLADSKIELYNYGNTAVSLDGFELRWSRVKNDGTADNMTIWECPASTTLKAGEYMTVTPSISLSSYNSTNIHIKLRNPNATDCTGEKIAWDDFKRGTEGSNWTKDKLSATTMAYARVPDGTGNWYLQSATLGKTNGASAVTPVPDVKID